MKLIIKGVRCDITEKTALAVMYPHRPWCETLAQAEREEERERLVQDRLDDITDYDVYSDVFKSIHGVRPRWLSRQAFAEGRRA